MPARASWACSPAPTSKITLRSGRFGPYVQLGEGEKPKRAGLPKGTDPSDVDLELAVKLLSLPREVGTHPEDGKMITANFGRFGPYVAHDGKYASLESPEDVFDDRPQPCRHPAGGKESQGPRPARSAGAEGTGRRTPTATPIKVLKGRFGPYVSDGDINATIARRHRARWP